VSFRLPAFAGFIWISLCIPAMASDIAPAPAPKPNAAGDCSACINDAAGKPHCYPIACKDLPPANIISQRLCVAGRLSQQQSWCVLPAPATVRPTRAR
jgi:hypothetical protein